MTWSWTIAATCPRCGADVAEVTRPADDKSVCAQMAVIVACTECTAEWIITVAMTAAAEDPDRRARQRTSPKQPAVCGTERRYGQHRRAGESCDRCKAAHSIYESRRQAGLPTDTNEVYVDDHPSLLEVSSS